MKPNDPRLPPTQPGGCLRCGAVQAAELDGLCLACLLDAGRDQPEEEAGAGASPSNEAAALIRRLGDYDLLEEIARGGMGVVYKARQRSLDRRVAVKTILSGQLARPEDIARFRLESAAAAQLKHPNIVAIHEVGEAEGQHFFSMDLVEGRSLSSAVRDGPWVALQAARCVEKIARAVHYAHECGVLHRDLKSSNVLLDAQGEPHVTDFGLAKRMDSSTDLTLSGQILGTPSFMPPEQATGQREQIGPRSDVYSIGAILYHLITGRPPFVGPDVHVVLDQVARTDVITPRLLNPSVPRDLETIALKCLEKHPGRRYASALALADDLHRYLNHAPIHAAPPSVTYRVRKFVRRHRAGVMAAVSIALVLVAASVVSTVFAWRADHQREIAVTARNAEAAERRKSTQAEAEAQESAADARSVLGFFADSVLTATRPLGEPGGLGRDVSIRAALDAAEPAIARDFAGRPKVEAEIRKVLGMTYHLLGDDALAAPQLERALEILHAMPGGLTNALDVMNNLGDVYRATGKHSNAISLLTAVVDWQETNRGPTNRSTLRGMTMLGGAYISAGQASNAIAILQRATQRYSAAAVHSDEIGRLDAMNALAAALEATGERSEALRLRQEVLPGYDAALGSTNRRTLTAMNNLGMSYARAGLTNEAIALYRKAIEGLDASLGPDHPRTLAFQDNLAHLIGHSGRRSEAILRYEEVQRRSLRRLGPNNPDTLTSANNLAMAYRDAGRIPLAIELLTNVVARARVALPPGHRDTLIWMHNLALMYRENGQSAAAEPLLKEEIGFLTSQLGPRSPRTQAEVMTLGRVYLDLDRLADAERVLTELWQTQSRNPPDEITDFADTCATLGDIKVQLDKYAEGEALVRQALVILNETGPGQSAAYAARAKLGWALFKQKRYDEAKTLLENAYKGLEAREAEEPKSVRRQIMKGLAGRLVQFHESLGHAPEAERWRERAR